MSNKVVLVDIFDNAIGECDKITAHKEKRLHRAFSLFIYHEGKFLLQRRALTKYHSAGKWANACCSHPTLEEDLLTCVISRAKEELGIDIITPKKLFDFIYYSEYDNGLTEYELDNVLIVDYIGDTKINPEEIDRVEWVDIDFLSQDLINNPTKYSTWFLNCAPRVISMIKNNQI